MNASKTSPSSQITLVKGQTSVPHLHSSVKGIIVVVVVVSVVGVVVVVAVVVVVVAAVLVSLSQYFAWSLGGLFSLLQFTFFSSFAETKTIINSTMTVIPTTVHFTTGILLFTFYYLKVSHSKRDTLRVNCNCLGLVMLLMS
jgi:hypothetical protein